MAKYEVTVPIAGSVIVRVEAASEQGARDAAIEKAQTFIQSWTVKENAHNQLVELEAYDEIVSGNVINVPTNEMLVERLKNKKK